MLNLNFGNIQALQPYLPFFIPLAVIQLGLAIFALVDVIRHPHYRFGNQVVWIIVVLLVSWIGPIVYLLAGRGEKGEQ